MDEAEKLTEKLMKLPRVIVAQQRRNTEAIVLLCKQQQQIITLICGLHDIELDEAQKELLSSFVLKGI